MAGIIWLTGFFLFGGILIFLTHRALVAENQRYGLTDEPPPTRQEAADAATHRRAA